MQIQSNLRNQESYIAGLAWFELNVLPNSMLCKLKYCENGAERKTKPEMVTIIFNRFQLFEALSVSMWNGHTI